MRCPTHGDVEGYFEAEGALSNAYPYPVLCDECIPGQTVIGYENENGQEVDATGAALHDKEGDFPVVDAIEETTDAAGHRKAEECARANGAIFLEEADRAKD